MNPNFRKLARKVETHWNHLNGTLPVLAALVQDGDGASAVNAAILDIEATLKTTRENLMRALLRQNHPVA